MDDRCFCLSWPLSLTFWNNISTTLVRSNSCQSEWYGCSTLLIYIYIYILCVSRYRSFLYIFYFNINRWSNKFLAWSYTIHFTLRVNPNLWPVFNSQFHRPIALGKKMQWVNPMSSHSLPEVEHQQLSCCCIVCVVWYVAWVTSTKGMSTWNHVPTRQRYVWNFALVLN